MMKRLMVMCSIAIWCAALVWAQAKWQGDVKRSYPVTLPAYKGKELVLMQMAAHKGDAAIEGYTAWHTPADAKPAFLYYRDLLVKQGFKPASQQQPTTTKGQERVDLYWAEKNWSAVVITTPYPDGRVSLGISLTEKRR